MLFPSQQPLLSWDGDSSALAAPPWWGRWAQVVFRCLNGAPAYWGAFPSFQYPICKTQHLPQRAVAMVHVRWCGAVGHSVVHQLVLNRASGETCILDNSYRLAPSCHLLASVPAELGKADRVWQQRPRAGEGHQPGLQLSFRAKLDCSTEFL